jgi:TIR domain-containing protein
MNAIYEICAFGDTSALTPELEAALGAHFGEFSLSIGGDVALDRGNVLTGRNPRTATVGLFFGSDPIPVWDLPIAMADTDPIIPVVSDLKRCSKELPPEASEFNAMATNGASASQKIAAATAECLGILPSRRRVFLSYRRVESTPVALQLYDALSKEQFDVFLDTHEIRPGALFQDALMHSLSDCDVLVMLDTPTYVLNHWTKVELVRANKLNCAVMRLGWPSVTPDSSFTYTDQILLNSTDFRKDRKLRVARVTEIVDLIERLRSKSVAVRQAKLLGTLRSGVQRKNGNLSHPGIMRRVEAGFPNGKNLQVYPIVEIPNSEHVERIALHAEPENCALLYNHLGVMESWREHLEWLGAKIDDFHWIRSGSIDADLTEAIK